jgi:hypothetical protein
MKTSALNHSKSMTATRKHPSGVLLFLSKFAGRPKLVRTIEPGRTVEIDPRDETHRSFALRRPLI